MDSDQKKARALGLSSGGLDSILAGLALRRQGIYVEWVSFETPFFSADKARKASETTGIPLTVRNITPVYLEMLKNPGCGYGKNMNPCMDCHSLMFRLAGEMMREMGFDFLFSGEVMGQRPMSQTKTSLRYVEKHSGFDGYIVRPLSIQRLPETIPEKQGLIDREKLYGISGRSRKAQMELAREFGVTDYPNPGGGCRLTDRNYSTRLRDLLRHQETPTENALHLLKYGRHFRINEQSKMVIGRDQKDNAAILRHYIPATDTTIKTPEVAGPLVLIPERATGETIQMATAVCVGYSKTPNHLPCEVVITTPDGQETVKVPGIPPEEVRHLLI
ncbi:tRNA 4-thiouridine(8) synthase ThiI [Desulfonema ishimotonii]|uniref:tRNA 4-thiouridine(8) synthase ThiI n=1 Tax=Desulfonema ishimotonii TaxID=45657 RepID=A0A401FYJ6_9BACT|nr:DUF814 domain-containing protein [Desulfonema ishimotonii]GBC62041.1 tRNA 4-thiouridine(8) synthase ThiI [Desulfonema ishimotonii]